MKQTKEYLSHDIILNCLANAMKICENKNVITVHMTDGDYMKVAEEFYKEMDLTNKKEIWFDVYNEGHTISTGHYKL